MPLNETIMLCWVAQLFKVTVVPAMWVTPPMKLHVTTAKGPVA